MKNSSFWIDIYADGADSASILKHYRSGQVQGFTTNPTLMAQVGIRDYEAFAKEILQTVTDLPISFEVFSDDFAEMHKQALHMSNWGDNVFVKIPISNTKGQMSYDLIAQLTHQGIKINVTAVFTKTQILELKKVLSPEVPAIVSVFAGRIADTGVDPEPIVRFAVDTYQNLALTKVLWASSREVFNVYQAERCGCHIITLTDSLLSKLKLKDYDLDHYSLDTVKMFYEDAMSSGLSLQVFGNRGPEFTENMDTIL